MGHSVGEYVAACVAGVFSLEDGLKLLAERGRLIQSLPSNGAMIAVIASQEDVQPFVREHAGYVAIAAINGPRNIVISGERSRLQSIAAALEKREISTRQLTVSQAFHSPLMDPILSQFDAVARTISYAPPQIPIVSNITGELVTSEMATPDYWRKHLRQSVRFAAGMQTLRQQGIDIFLEIGPKPTLLNMGRRCFSEDVGTWLPSLTPELQDWDRMLRSLGQLYTRGFSINWLEFDRPYPRHPVPLPTYPFERQRYWFSDSHTPVMPEPLATRASPQPGDEGLSRPHIFKPIWQPSQLPTDSVPAVSQQKQRSVLIFIPDESWLDPIQTRLKDSAAQWIFVRPGTTDLPENGRLLAVNPADADAYSHLLTHLTDRGIQITDILLLWNANRCCETLDELGNGLEESKQQGLMPLYHVTRALIQQGRCEKPIAICYGFQSTKQTAQPDQSCGVGLALSAISEASWLRYRFIQIQQERPSAVEFVNKALAESDRGASVEEIRYSKQGRWVRQIQPHPFQQDGQPPFNAFPEGGVVLVTGGAGGLGLIVAKALAKRYRARLLLTGRSPSSEQIQSRLLAIESAGGEVIYRQADVTDEAQMQACVADVKQKWGRLDGVIHAAGIGGQGSRLVEMEREELERIVAPKIRGSLVVDRATREEPLSFFILFSSLSACLSTANLSAYATANRFMDDFAALREQHRLQGERQGQTLAINWPHWREGGMRIAAEREASMVQTTGIETLLTAVGVRALLYAMLCAERDGLSQAIVAPGEYERVKQTLTRPTRLAYPLTGVPTNFQERSGNVRASRSALLPLLADDLSQLVVKTLQLRRDRIKPDEDLADLGFESITVTELTEAINKKFAIQISPAILYEHRTVQSYATYLLQEYRDRIQASYQLTEVEGNRTPTPQLVAPNHQVKPLAVNRDRHDAQSRDIAIIGMDGIFPGSPDLNSFWHHLEAERDLLSEIPRERFQWEDYQSAIAANRGGFIDDIDKFDPLFFRISPYEAEMMDPQQRLFLQTAWRAIEDAGHRPSELADRQIGVFIGVTTADYADVLAASGKDLEASVVTGISASVLANRISYLLDLHGPSEPVDTGCSSSLVAVHRAIRSLRSGECEAALVGGVNLLISPKPFITCTRAGMLSPDGRCKTFDRDANGYVRGEGIGAIFLKPLTAAIADGDRVYAVIKGSAVNHGGHVVQGLTVPNPNAQASCLAAAYRDAEIDPSAVTYIEVHGTGTALGDPIEVNALKKVFNSQSHPRTHPCGLGTVKTNIGHLESAAGIAGLIKVALAMKHRKIPASLHFETLNPHIELEGSPFYVVDQTQPWNPDSSEPRRAGVSSFGFGGVNAHVVLEEFSPSASGERADVRPQLIPLSAKSPEQLQQVVKRFAEHLQLLQSQEANLSLADIAFTLQVGREPMEHRLIAISDTLEAILSSLNRYLELEDGSGSAHLITGVSTEQSYSKTLLGQSNEGREFIENAIAQQRWHDLARLWVEGVTIPWTSLHRGYSRQRVPLPTHPFKKRRCWVDAETGKPADTRPQPHSTTSSQNVSVTNLAAIDVKPFAMQHEQETIQLDLGVEELQAVGRQRLLAVFQSMGVFSSSEERHSQNEIEINLGVDASQKRLFNEFLKLLVKQGYIQIQGDNIATTKQIYTDSRELIALADRQQEILKKFPDLRAFATLLDRCLDILPDVLRGNKEGIEAFFPDGKTELVETIYKNNQVTDYFNTLVKLAIRRIVEERKPSADRQLRILEVGAGTGSTTESIIAGLQDYRDRVQYTYTDITVALVSHGRQRFADRFPNLVCQVLNIEQTIESQGFSPHSFDIIVAANVIHATRDIKKTLTKVNALLKPGGILALYELTKTTDFGTLTFALLKGWWLFEDRERIQSNSPILTVPQWRQHLEQAGFHCVTVLGQPTVAEETLRQAVILSEKFSHLPTATLKLATPSAPTVHQSTALPGDSIQLAIVSDRDLSKQVQAYLVGIFSEILKLQPEEIETQPRFERLGIDSLVSLQIVKRMERDLGTLPKTLLLEYGSIPSIARFLIDERRAACEQFLLSSSVVPKDPIQPVLVSDRDFSKQIQTYLVGIFSEILKLQPEEIETQPRFERLGIDSLVSLQIVKRMERDLGTLPKTLLLEYGSIPSIARFLIDERRAACEQFLLSSSEQAASADPTELTEDCSGDSITLSTSIPVAVPERKPPIEDIAIVGIGGLFPGSPTIEDFWIHLKECNDPIGEIPPDRFDWSQIYGDPRQNPNRGNSKWGGFLEDIAAFDPLFFGISPTEAELMDPQQRLFLQVVWKTIEDSGYRPSHFRNMGVFVGICTSDYVDLVQKSGQAVNAHAPSGLAHSILANRISFLMDWHGPSEPVNTACSSSLVAVHRAVQAIRNGECEAAIAGGVNIIITPQLYVAYSQAGFLSPDGCCRPFDRRANGFVRGEGVGAALLKPLQRALKDGDHIYAVIKTTGVNHGGRVQSLTVPNSHAQADLICQAYKKAGIDPRTISYIEAHGTGTELGDPLEINGLKRAFDSLTSPADRIRDRPYCGVGSVKANIGHLEASAGIAGLIKVLLCMKHKTLPGSPHFEALNPYIDLEGSPFYILSDTKPWETFRNEQGSPLPRRAGVSSFGFGGANAHVLLEEYDPPATDRREQDANPLSELILLSARNRERLHEYIKLLSVFLDNHSHENNPPLCDIAYTLQVGREPMAARIALRVTSKAELIELLQSLVRGTLKTDKVFISEKTEPLPRFESEREKQAWLQDLIADNQYDRLARHWVNGMEINWESLNTHLLRHRVSLPTYPFASERYWLSPSPSPSEDDEGTGEEATWAQLLTQLQNGEISLEEVNQAIAL